MQTTQKDTLHTTPYASATQRRRVSLWVVCVDSAGGDLLLVVYLPTRMRNTVVRTHHHWVLLSKVTTTHIKQCSTTPVLHFKYAANAHMVVTLDNSLSRHAAL